MKKIHLVCNAHIDPIWLWKLEDGIAEALSTFRVAADFCDRYDGFVFNHNEALLYEMVEKYEPELFERIKKLIKDNKWFVIGGWYVQPDCNMPSGEAMARQISYGRHYFKSRFGVEPTTAINFDSFGHSRGLVQLLAKSGYDSYLFCRPNLYEIELPALDMVWEGYDGSSIVAQRHFTGYSNHQKGGSIVNIEKYLTDYPDRQTGLVLWGIGNHGGGPSEEDLKNIEKLRSEQKDYEIIHSTPEEYFKIIVAGKNSLPVFRQSLNYIFVGCYTSQIRIKQKYRQLENDLFAAEKMSSAACAMTGMAYPHKDLLEAQKDMMLVQFHDVLCGTSIKPAEDDILRQIDHGLELCARARTDAFFALAVKEEIAEKDSVPLFVFNPHPYEVSGIYECEYSLPIMNRSPEFNMPRLYQDGKEVLCQPERELSYLAIDWQKRIVFDAKLAPLSLTRFDIKTELLPQKPVPALKENNGVICFETGDMKFEINTKTGAADKYIINGVNYIKEGAFLPITLTDSDEAKVTNSDSNHDPWAMHQKSFRADEKRFVLASEEETAVFCGFKDRKVNPVRVIEDGNVRTVVEVLFKYNESYVNQRYLLPKKGTQIGIKMTVYWNEQSRALKMRVPTTLQNSIYTGQTMFGREEMPSNGNEAVSQKWSACSSLDTGKCVITYNDGFYGSDCLDGEIRLTLLRSAVYSYLCLDYGADYRGNSFLQRFDIGEREYNIWFDAGETNELMRKAERTSLSLNEKPYMQAFFPPKGNMHAESFVKIEGSDTVIMSALKKCDPSQGEKYIIRLFEPTGNESALTLICEKLDITYPAEIKGFEILTLCLDVLKNEIKVLEGAFDL
ncbi:MAG: glycoside hydrolase family 38 N-terminal domain-containing protein [Saccharofermentanales bacterium]